MNVEDYYAQGKRWWVRLHEKGGKQHEMPCHHLLETYIDANVTAAGIGADATGAMFWTLGGRGRKQLSATGIIYLLNGELLEYAQQMAAHESARTTKLYDRRNDQVTLDQVERIVL